MPRSLPRLAPLVLPLALPIVLLACPAGRPGSSTAAPPPGHEGSFGRDGHGLSSGSPAGSTPGSEPDDPAAIEAARRARLAQDARVMRPPPDPGAIPPDAETTASGIAYQVLVDGTGPAPGPDDTVEILVAVWAANGTPVEALSHREAPQTIRMNAPPVPGLREALALVAEGGTTRFWIPETLINGDGGRGALPGGTLLFQVTLTEVVAAPPTPADVAAPPSDATVTRSGLAFKVLTPGTGTVHPDPHDRVKVHYSGWTTDGAMFDSSVTRGRPATFPLDRVIEGWTEGLQRMVVGERTRLWIPEALAYKGAPGKPAGMLVFDVELLEIDEQPEPPKPPATPKSLTRPPRRAKRTSSGLAYRVLSKGTGKQHPGPTSVVKVHYSGWTTDGTLFDSSVTRGQPASFPLDRVIEGWTEGVQRMVVGEKARFWIPEDLAYKGSPGKPAGMLIFDIELLAIEE